MANFLLTPWSTGFVYPEALLLIFRGSHASRTFMAVTMAMSFDSLSGLQELNALLFAVDEQHHLVMMFCPSSTLGQRAAATIKLVHSMNVNESAVWPASR